MGRLLGAVAHNPRVLGIGIDEDTAIVVEEESCFYDTGRGAVYVVDGAGVTHSNIAEEDADAGRALSIYDVRLHVLSQGDEFDLRTRRPAEIPRSQAQRQRQAEAPADGANREGDDSSSRKRR